MSALPADRIIRTPEACAIAGVSKSTLRRREIEGLVTKRVRLGPNSSGWWLSQFIASLRALPCGLDLPHPQGEAARANLALAPAARREGGRRKGER